MKTPRRTFLKSAAALPAVVPAASASPALLPAIPLGKFQVTRLIIGANPFYGYSHFNRIFDDVMREWSTTENVCQTLSRCEQNGINTWQFSYNQRSMADLERHRAGGGRLQWILLSSRELHEDPELIKRLAKTGPIGIVHHGGVTDNLCRRREFDKIRTFLKQVRDSGVMVGMSSHTPANIARAEDEGWDTDFYMTCCYQVTRTADEVRKITGELPLPAGEVYLEGDPARMFKVVRQTKKPCLAFKILAAGRRVNNAEDLERAFQFTFDSIKSNDAVIVGMFPKFKDEVTDDASRVRRILRA